jgi:hypothetical protein
VKPLKRGWGGVVGHILFNMITVDGMIFKGFISSKII